MPIDKESVSLISTFINETGFPIFACVAMFWLYYRTVKPLQKSITELAEAVRDLKGDVKDVKREVKQ